MLYASRCIYLACYIKSVSGQLITLFQQILSYTFYEQVKLPYEMHIDYPNKFINK